MRPLDQSNLVMGHSLTGIMLQRNTQMLWCDRNVKASGVLSHFRHFLLDTRIADS
jgi:hypothetical protein